MKKILSLFLVSISLFANAQTYFSDDFSNGIGNFITYDMDGLIPASNVSSYFGTTVPYKAWTILASSGNLSAFSTSSYSPTGTSNDWLVTSSPINIQSAQANLIWRARSFSSTLLDGYKVFISTTGNKVSDFTGVPALTIAAEAYSWTTRNINLSAYVGQSIYIAFVNNSNAKYLLTIDDIFVGMTNFTVVDNTTQYIYSGAAKVTGTIINKGNPITSFTAKYTSNGQTYTKNYSGLNLTTGSSYVFEFPELIAVNIVGNSVSYTLEITSGTISKTSKGSVTWASFKPTKKVVGEEATGTWCGWCPRGAVFLKSTSEKYPDSFIGIAVHNGDPMTYPAYDNGMRSFISGYPSGLVDRNYSIDPSAFESSYLTALNDFCPASFKLTGEFTDETKRSVKLTTNTVFNSNYNAATNFRIAFVVTENNVKGTASGYYQANFYAGGGNGVMGGFEFLSNPVPASQMTYQDVARKIYDSFTGIAGSVPATIIKEQALTFNYTLELPTTINNFAEMSIVALLIDLKTGKIANADRVKASSLSITAVETPFSSNLSAEILYNANEIKVNVATNSVGFITASLFGIDGKQIYTSSVNNENKFNFSIPNSGLRGIYLIRVKTLDGIIDKKIII